jgi:hypothetical protein
MACCPCCCENKQGGTCCGDGDSAACCDPDDYCCDGACQSSPCDNCCFVDLFGSYSFTFGSISGTIVNGYYLGSGGVYLFVECTPDPYVCGSLQASGLKLQVFDGTDTWEGSVAGDPTTHPCTGQQGLDGTYSLQNCTTLATQSMVIT